MPFLSTPMYLACLLHFILSSTEPMPGSRVLHMKVQLHANHEVPHIL